MMVPPSASVSVTTSTPPVGTAQVVTAAVNTPTTTSMNTPVPGSAAVAPPSTAATLQSNSNASQSMRPMAAVPATATKSVLRPTTSSQTTAASNTKLTTAIGSTTAASQTAATPTSTTAAAPTTTQAPASGNTTVPASKSTALPEAKNPAAVTVDPVAAGREKIAPRQANPPPMIPASAAAVQTQKHQTNAELAPLSDSGTSGTRPILMKDTNMQDFIVKYENYRTSNWSDKEKCDNLVHFVARAEERLVVEALVAKYAHNWTALKDELKTLQAANFVINSTTAVKRLKKMMDDKLNIKTLLPDLLLLKTCFTCIQGLGIAGDYLDYLMDCLPTELATKDVLTKLKATTTQMDAERVVISAASTLNSIDKTLASTPTSTLTSALNSWLSQFSVVDNAKPKASKKDTATTRAGRKTARTVSNSKMSQTLSFFSKHLQPVIKPSPQFYIPQFRGWIEGRRTVLNVELDSAVNLMSISAFKNIPGLVLSLLDASFEITGFFDGGHNHAWNTTVSQPSAPLGTPSQSHKDAMTATTATSNKTESTYCVPDDNSDQEEEAEQQEDDGDAEEAEEEEEASDNKCNDDGDKEKERRRKEDQEEKNRQEKQQATPNTPGLQTLHVEGVCKHALIKFGDLEQEAHIWVVADHPAIANTGVVLGMPFLQDSASRVVADNTGDFWLMLKHNGPTVALRFVHD